MSIFDIIYNAKSKVHKENMDCQLKVFRALIYAIRDEQDAGRKLYYATNAFEILDRIEKSDEVVYRTVSTLFKSEIEEMTSIIALQTEN